MGGITLLLQAAQALLIYFSLHQDDEWFCYKGSRNSMILEWLGLGVTAFSRNGAENPVAENAGKRLKPTGV